MINPSLAAVFALALLALPAVAQKPEARPSRDQRVQIEIAVRRGRAKAENCPRAVGVDAPFAEVAVTVVADGAKGRLTDATVGEPAAGTALESCIRRSFLGEIIPPFEGEALSLRCTIRLAPKEALPEK